MWLSRVPTHFMIGGGTLKHSLGSWWERPTLATDGQLTTPRDRFMSLIGWLTASVSDTTMALIWKLLMVAEKRFRRVRGSEHCSHGST